MIGMANSYGIDQLLTELADFLEFEEVGSVELLVCGGTALGLQGLIHRETLDVDVLGSWDSGLVEVVYQEEFSEKVKSCIKRVAGNHSELPEDWVNLGPRKLIGEGLPVGFENRIKTKKYGKTLTIHLLAREDLIPLKLYAASDRTRKRPEVDIGDLRVMKATFQELESALDWMRKLKNYEEMKPDIQNALERLGYDDLAIYV